MSHKLLYSSDLRRAPAHWVWIVARAKRILWTGVGKSIMTLMWDMVGRKLGDYRLVEAIGAGAMGSVFRAENIHHQKAYALKVLRSELGRETDFRRRFFDEARVLPGDAARCRVRPCILSC